MKQLLTLALILFLSFNCLAAKPKAAKAPKPVQDPPSYVLWELDSNKVLEQKNGEIIRPMASITKLMTAYVVIISGVNLDETVTVTGTEASNRIKVGQQLTRRELLDFTLVNSDNLAARTLAETSLVSYESFLDKMNFTAKFIGMSNTYYNDSTGLLASNVTSPDDLKILVQAVGEHPVFNLAAMSPGTTTVVRYKKKVSTHFNPNTNWLAGKMDILAAKTGTTNAAGRCLTMLFNKNGHKYMLVVLGARHAQERQRLVQNLLDKIS